MYRIITPTGETILTEKVNYIRVHKSGVYLLTDVNHAEGVAHHGTPYLFKDGAQVCEVDDYEVVTQEDAKNREAVEQAITDLYLDGIQAQQDITDIQLQLLEGYTMTYERSKERYLKNYITDAQLERFKTLGIINEAQYTELYELKHPAVTDTRADNGANG